MKLTHFSPPPSSYTEVHKSMSQYIAEDNAAKRGTANIEPRLPAETAKPIAVKIRRGGIQKRSLAKSILGANRAD